MTALEYRQQYQRLCLAYSDAVVRHTDLSLGASALDRARAYVRPHSQCLAEPHVMREACMVVAAAKEASHQQVSDLNRRMDSLYAEAEAAGVDL